MITGHYIISEALTRRTCNKKKWTQWWFRMKSIDFGRCADNEHGVEESEGHDRVEDDAHNWQDTFWDEEGFPEPGRDIMVYQQQWRGYEAEQQVLGHVDAEQG